MYYKTRQESKMKKKLSEKKQAKLYLLLSNVIKMYKLACFFGVRPYRGKVEIFLDGKERYIGLSEKRKGFYYVRRGWGGDFIEFFIQAKKTHNNNYTRVGAMVEIVNQLLDGFLIPASQDSLEALRTFIREKLPNYEKYSEDLSDDGWHGLREDEHCDDEDDEYNYY